MAGGEPGACRGATELTSSPPVASTPTVLVEIIADGSSVGSRIERIAVEALGAGIVEALLVARRDPTEGNDRAG